MARRKNYGSKTHKVFMTVTFDKPCGRKWAVKEIREGIFGYGEVYPIPNNDVGPEEFCIRSIVTAGGR